MDISNYNLRPGAEEGFDLVIRDPVTSKKTDLIIRVAGSDSKAYRNAKAAAMRDLVKSGGEKEVDELTASVMSRCILGWENMAEGETPVEFSQPKAFELLSNLGWLLDQVSEAVENRLNFTTPAETP